MKEGMRLPLTFIKGEGKKKKKKISSILVPICWRIFILQSLLWISILMPVKRSPQTHQQQFRVTQNSVAFKRNLDKAVIVPTVMLTICKESKGKSRHQNYREAEGTAMAWAEQDAALG